MKHVLNVATLAVAMAGGSEAQTTWTVDNAHSNVKFSVRHMVISEVEGNFKVYSGSVQTSGQDFVDAAVKFTVDVNSINTDNDMRDKHLKSDDFFNAERYPVMTFKSTSWKKVDDQRFTVTGDLTIRNITKAVTFTVVYGGSVVDGYGNTRAGFRGTATINRFDYNLKWNALTEAGGAVVSKDVDIALNLEFVQSKSS